MEPLQNIYPCYRIIKIKNKYYIYYVNKECLGEMILLKINYNLEKPKT